MIAPMISAYYLCGKSGGESKWSTPQDLLARISAEIVVK
jgi:hypothetical protein